MDDWPMELMTRAALDQYLGKDRILERIRSLSIAGDEDLTCQKWLLTTPAKRMIFDRLYGDLIDGSTNLKRRILDVGGGLTSFTRHLAKMQNYDLVDLIVHDGPSAADVMETEVGRRFIARRDWLSFNATGQFDVIIANDMFPNVDQRLVLFIEKFLPATKEIRVSLTYYNELRFYMTRRLDADEVFCMLAWDGEATARALRKFTHRIIGVDLKLFSTMGSSIFPNGRDVIVMRICGDAELPAADARVLERSRR
jgi:hypothetical protein